MRGSKLIKWVWRTTLWGVWAYQLLGFYLPGRTTGIDWLVDLEVALVNHVPDPILFSFLTGLLFSTMLAPDIWQVVKRQLGLGPTPVPDMKVSEAIDYIVNDSRAELQNPKELKPESLGRYPPGTVLTVSGIEHEDARKQLNARLISGEVRSWGLREVNTHIPNQFEHSLREIQKEYWEDMELDFQSCLYYRDSCPQTIKIPGRGETFRWAAIRLSKHQVTHFWPPKPVWSRCFAKIMNKSRIGHARRIDI